MASPDPMQSHVLIVDDEDGVRQLVQRYFSSNGFRVSEAADAASARRLLESEKIELVLLDIGLPGEDGLALTRYLREHWHGAVIIVSGRGDPIERVIGLEIGADDYVAKPFE
ncbi:MAG TPA: response regulator, partial [Arenimonas sp.]|nr:response regulator [Arenimonas sp.]